MINTIKGSITAEQSEKLQRLIIRLVRDNDIVCHDRRVYVERQTNHRGFGSDRKEEKSGRSEVMESEIETTLISDLPVTPQSCYDWQFKAAFFVKEESYNFTVELRKDRLRWLVPLVGALAEAGIAQVEVQLCNNELGKYLSTNWTCLQILGVGKLKVLVDSAADASKKLDKITIDLFDKIRTGPSLYNSLTEKSRINFLIEILADQRSALP